MSNMRIDKFDIIEIILWTIIWLFIIFDIIAIYSLLI